jgi:hypothetical protein
MDATTQLKCVEAAGLITGQHLQNLTAIANRLPTSVGDLLAIIASAMIVGNSGTIGGTPLDTESVTSHDDTDSMGLDVPAGASSALVSVHGNNIIFRTDGVAPATNAGHFAAQGSNFVVNDLANFHFVAASTTDATIFVSYY